MKIHLNSARAATLAFPPPTTVLRPWLAFKSFSPRLPDFLTDSGPVHYYQEEVIHAAITGTDLFFYWFAWDGYASGTRALMSDHQVLSDVLHELDSVIGCALRQWVVDEDIMIAPQSASFYLSGVRVGPPQPAPATATIWRFTPMLPVGHPGEDADHALSVLNEMVQAQGGDVFVSNVSHDGLICDLQFPQSRLVRVANASTAPYGVWISMMSNATVLLKCTGQPAVPWPLRRSDNRQQTTTPMKYDDVTSDAKTPFHTIHSDRFPCLQNTGGKGPNACPNSTTRPGRHLCPCYVSSNSFGAVEVTHGLRTGDCNVSSYPTKCLTSVADVVDTLRLVPAGQRAISWLAHYLPRVVKGKMETSSTAAVWDLDDAGNTMPWADEWQAVVEQRLDEWFGDYKAAGGPNIDIVFHDLESLIFGFGHHFGKFANNSAVFSPWVADPRWPALLAELNARGEPYGLSFNDMAAAANTSCCGESTCAPGCDTTVFYSYVWNEVMSQRIAKMMNASLYHSIAKHYPQVQVSNYDQAQYSTEPTYWAGSRTSYVAPPIGTGCHVGTHSSRSFYNGDSEITQLSITLPYTTINRTASPFGRLLLSTRAIRSMARQFPSVMPWLEPRESNWTKSGRSLMHDSDIFQETLLHLSMAGTKRFLWWRSSRDFPLTLGIELANCVMVEADIMVGDAARTPLSLDEVVSLEDGYVLSSMRLGDGSIIHRFTPSDEQPLPKFKILSENPATFLIAGHVVTPVAKGALIPASKGSCAPGGYWVRTGSEDAAKVTHVKTDDQQLTPATVGLAACTAHASSTLVHPNAGLDPIRLVLGLSVRGAQAGNVFPSNITVKQQERVKTDDKVAPGSRAWEIFYDLGDSGRAPATYNISRFGFTTGSCPGVRGVPHDWCFANTWTRDPSAGFASLWPGMIEEDRGGDGLPCTSQKCSNGSCVFREPCHNFSWTKQCKGTKIDTGTPFGALCCKAGGCAPQEGNLSEIIAAVGRFVTAHVNESMTGSCALDHESWNNIVTSESFGACKIPGEYTRATASFMRNYSIALVLKRQPELTHTEAAAIASREYSESATAIMVGALKAAKAARPLCHWGYWGLPCTYPLPCAGTRPAGESGAGEPLCGFDHPKIGPALRAQAQQMQPIVDASDTLYPEIYPPSVGPDEGFKTEHARNRARYLCQYNLTNPHTPAALKPHCRTVSLAMLRAGIRSTIGQAVRSAASVGTRHNRTPMVIPYLWQWCGTAFPCFEANASHHLSREGIEASLRLPYELGADAEVIWVGGEEASCKNASTGAPAECEAGELLTKMTGPLSQQLLEEAAQCSTQHCSGHGRCRPHGCKCFAGYAGPTCSGLSATSMVKTDDGNTLPVWTMATVTDNEQAAQPRWLVGMFGACALSIAADNTTSLGNTLAGATINTCTRADALNTTWKLSTGRMRGFLNMGLGYSRYSSNGKDVMGVGWKIWNTSCNTNRLDSANDFNCGGHSGLLPGWETVINDAVATIGPGLREGSIIGAFLVSNFSPCPPTAPQSQQNTNEALPAGLPRYRQF